MFKLIYKHWGAVKIVHLGDCNAILKKAYSVLLGCYSFLLRIKQTVFSSKCSKFEELQKLKLPQFYVAYLNLQNCFYKNFNH